MDLQAGDYNATSSASSPAIGKTYIEKSVANANGLNSGSSCLNRGSRPVDDSAQALAIGFR